MTALAERVVRQRGITVALAAAGGLLAVIVMQSVLGDLLSFVATVSSYNEGPFQWWPGYSAQFLTVALPFSVGVFLSLWLLAPIGAPLHILHVITRAVLASVVGAVAVFLVTSVLDIMSLFVTNGLMGPIRLADEAGRGMISAFGAALAVSGGQFLSATPLVILVAVLVRLWLEQHPPKHDVVGIVDSV